MEEDEVVLWKAPQPGRPAEQEIVNGFDPQNYPGNGPYLALDKEIADTFQEYYGNGLQKICMPRSLFKDLVKRRIILSDPFYEAGASWCVPPQGLWEFNEAIKKGFIRVSCG